MKEYGKGPHYTNHATATLPVATAHTPTLIAYAHQCLKRIYKEGYAYKKAGVMIQDVTPREAVQGDLFAAKDQQGKSALMDVMDVLNARYGRGTVFFAATGMQPKPWQMKQVLRSPRYTTRWGELVRVKT